MLLERFHSLVEEGWQPVFARRASRHRAIEQATAHICVFGHRLLSRVICTLGRHDQDWSADYKIFSRSPWKGDALFDPVLKEYLRRFPERRIVIALDDTILKKTGRKIETVRFLRDPMSFPFWVNLIRGLRFVQATLLLPLYREGDHSARSLPIRFRESPPLKKPGKQAGEEECENYREAKKQHTLSLQALEVIRSVRTSLDDKGAGNRRLLISMDGSYCNRTMFRAELERVDLVARCRKDASLCFPAPPGSRRRYGETSFTPEAVRKDETIPWKKASVYYGGQWREVRYKAVSDVLWRRGALTRPLRLIVIAPQPYKPSPHSKTLYRDAAYLLCTDLSGEEPEIIQAYLDRWQIECNHRDEKEILGVGRAQVRSPKSVARHPAFAVAVYSILLLAGLLEFGPARTEHYIPLPNWRKKTPTRPSILDLIAVMRKEINETAASDSEQANFYKNIAKYGPLYACT